MKLGEILKGHFNRGRSLTFRTSQLGRCHRSIQYGALRLPQEEAPEKTKKMWKERIEDEYTIVSKLKKKYKLKYTGDNHMTFHRSILSNKNCILAGTPDGLVKNEEEWVPLEIKSLNPYRFNVINKPEDLSREYFLQVQGEMIVTGANRALYVIGNSKTKKEIKELVIPLDDRIQNWIGDRISYIMEYIDQAKIIYPEYPPFSKKCVWCLYKERCEKDVYKLPKINYTDSVKIKKGEYEYNQAARLGRDIRALFDQYDDFKSQIELVTFEARDFLLRKKVKQFSVGTKDVSIKDILKLERGIR